MGAVGFVLSGAGAAPACGADVTGGFPCAMANVGQTTQIRTITAAATVREDHVHLPSICSFKIFKPATARVLHL